MNTIKRDPGFSQTLIALAVLATFGPAYAQDIGELTAPGNTVSVGIGYTSGDDKDRARFGLYNGLRNESVNGLLGFEYLNREDATGTWTYAVGRNLGLDNRELFISRNRQGDWKLDAGYSEITRHDPRTIHTGLIGAGTVAPTVVTVAPRMGSEVDLKLKRKGLTFGGEKWFLGNTLQLQLNFKNEDKDGARQFGKGFACGGTWSAVGICAGTEWALLMLPEPVNSNIKQVEAKLNYHTDKLLLSGGYYGSFYNNSNSFLDPNVPGPLRAPTAPASAAMLATMGLPVALPPDNQAHQVYLSGNYRFTPKTNATFKYSYTHGTQNEAFPAVFAAAAPGGIGNLGGVVDTSLYQLGLTTRPIPKLSLLANLRYEDKRDKTPLAYYNTEGAAPSFTNSNNSHQRLNAKAEGSYQLPQNFRATLGLDYEEMDRGIPVITTEIAGLTALREKTEETTWRAELRKAMSESLTGAVQYSSARRTGSDYIVLATGGGGTPFPVVPAGTLIATSSATNIVVPAMLTDRTRDKWKLSANWTPADRVSLQFWVEDGRDKYDSPIPRGNPGVPQTAKGLRDTGVRLYSIDGSFVVSDGWKLNAYYSRGEQTIHVNHSTGYMAALKNTNDSVGLGVTGKPSSRFQLGADLSYINDKNVYEQRLSPGGTTGAFLAYGLPDVTFNQIRLKLFGQYAVQKNAYVRLDLIHQHSKLDEWTWGYRGVPFVYNDNTTISAKETQNATFIGVTYNYRFQ